MNHVRRFIIVLICCAPASLLAAEATYPRPDLLLEPTELAKPEVAGRFVILDVRGQEAYEKGHIPAALRVDHDTWKAAFDGGKDVKGWSRRIGELGIGNDTAVVLYDDNATKDAARIWWLLTYWGVQDARLLNGGWKTWTAMDLPTSQVPAPSPRAVAFEAKPITKRLTDKDQILGLLGEGKLQIVDARSFDEFCGVEPRKNKRAGAIPGAKHLEWSDLIDEKTDRFKSPSEIRTLFHKAGIDLKRPTATHCQSGGRASVMAFGMELMGAKDVRNYYKGWSEWGNAGDTPIEQRKPEPK